MAFSPFFNQKTKNIPSNIFPRCIEKLNLPIHIVKGEGCPEGRGCEKMRIENCFQVKLCNPITPLKTILNPKF